MTAIAAGDRDALAQLYRETSTKLFGICLQTLPSRAEAEDALQDVYVTVWRKAGLYDPARASPITWLAAVARNRCVDSLRRKRVQVAPLAAAADLPDGSDSAFAVIERQDDHDQLHRCLDELEDGHRDVIKSAFLEGLTYSELAQIRDVPLGTMKSWIRRSLVRLRGCIER